MSISNMTFRAFGPLSGWIGRARAARARTVAYQSLRRVNDAALKDIGISRSELHSICFADPKDRRRYNV